VIVPELGFSGAQKGKAFEKLVEIGEAVMNK